MLDRPIFIISQHRTGSTLLKNAFDANSKIAMATDEMQLFTPFVKSFGNYFYEFGDLKEINNVDNLIDFVYSKKIRGKFWEDYIELGIPKKTIKTEFLNTNRTLKSFISVLLNEFRKTKQKDRVGAKYPLHFSKSTVLNQWYPNAKIILLHRDIRAVCASKLNDNATKQRKKKIGLIIHYITLFLFVADYICMIKYYKKNKGLFHFVDYNKLVSNPEKILKDICRYCEIELEDTMFNAIGKPSSHGGEIKRGFDRSRITNWKNKLNKFDKWLISSLTKNSRKIFV